MHVPEVLHHLQGPGQRASLYGWTILLPRLPGSLRRRSCGHQWPLTRNASRCISTPTLVSPLRLVVPSAASPNFPECPKKSAANFNPLPFKPASMPSHPTTPADIWSNSPVSRTASKSSSIRTQAPPPSASRVPSLPKANARNPASHLWRTTWRLPRSSRRGGSCSLLRGAAASYRRSSFTLGSKLLQNKEAGSSPASSVLSIPKSVSVYIFSANVFFLISDAI
jgi:hypothetical protein